MKLVVRRNFKHTIAGRLIFFVGYFAPLISMLWRECWRHDEYVTTCEVGKTVDQKCLKVKKHQNYFRLNSDIKLLRHVIGSEAHIGPIRAPFHFGIYLLAFIPNVEIFTSTPINFLYRNQIA